MNEKVLQELIDRGIINEEKLLDQLAMAKRQDYLSRHKYPIWQNQNDGRWYTYLPDETAKYRRKMLRRSTEEDLKKEIIAFYKKTEHIPTVNDMFHLWVSNKRQNVLSQTIMRYESNFRRYIEHSWFGKMHMEDVTFKHLSKFCSETIGKDRLTSKCWAGIRTDLIGIIRTAKIEGLSTLSINDLKDLDIAKNVFLSRVTLPEEDVITNAEERKLVEYINEHDDDIVLLGIRLLFKTGLRIGELCALKYSDFDFVRGTVTVTRTEERVANPIPKALPKTIITVRERTKGAKGWREVIIDPETEELVKKIRSFNPTGEFLFEAAGERIRENVWSKRLPRLCASLGIGTRAVKNENGEIIERNYVLKKSTHKSRKNYISNLLHSGVDPKFVQVQVGHTDVTTTLKYYDRITEDFETRKQALLPSLSKL